MCEQIDEWHRVEQHLRYERAQEMYDTFQHTDVDVIYLEMINDMLAVCSVDYFSAKAFTKLQQTIIKNLKQGPFKQFQKQPKVQEDTDDFEEDSEAQVVQSSDFTEFLMEDDRIQEIVADMRQNIIPKDHQVNLSMYKNCLSGKDIVTWVKVHLNSTREEAVSILSLIQRKTQLFKHVQRRITQVQQIIDSASKLYRFRKRVVIVGGGFSGIVAARKLQDDFQVILITSSPHFECTPDYPHLISDPSYLQQIRYDYRKCLVNTQVLFDKVDHITLNHIVLSGEKKHDGNSFVTDNEGNYCIEYDYLIVGTGRRLDNKFPVIVNNQERHASVINPYHSDEIVSNSEYLRRAKKIVVIGGGPMGTEIVAECAATFTKASVVLLTDGKEILTNAPKRAQQSSLTSLKRHKNITIKTECKVTAIEDNIVHYTDASKSLHTIEADVVFKCTGTIPNSEMFEKCLPHALDVNTKEVIVDQHFRIQQGTAVPFNKGNNIFAIGDITNIKEPKVSSLAMNHGKTIGKVIHAIECGDKLPKYEPGSEPIRVALGRDDSVIVVKNEMVTNPIKKIAYKRKLSGGQPFKI